MDQVASGFFGAQVSGFGGRRNRVWVRYDALPILYQLIWMI